MDDERHGFSFERAQRRAAMIFETTRTVFAHAEADGVPPAVAADRVAERRIAQHRSEGFRAPLSADRSGWGPTS